jgi:hypothetical protein
VHECFDVVFRGVVSAKTKGEARPNSAAASVKVGLSLIVNGVAGLKEPTVDVVAVYVEAGERESVPKIHRHVLVDHQAKLRR